MIPIYRSNPYQSECNSIIDRVLTDPSNHQQTVFLREALFMEGGGQPMDHGKIIVDGNEFSLLKIVKEKGNTGYVISNSFECQKGMTANCILDSARRLKIMRLHSAQHALAGCIRLLDESILTGGMSISDEAEICKVLYPKSSNLTDKILEEGLILTTEFIASGKAVNVETVSSEQEAISKYGATYRPTIASGTLKGKIRLVVIEDLDANACGGTHVKRLEEIGRIDVIDVRELADAKEVTFKVN